MTSLILRSSAIWYVVDVTQRNISTFQLINHHWSKFMHCDCIMFWSVWHNSRTDALEFSTHLVLVINDERVYCSLYIPFWPVIALYLVLDVGGEILAEVAWGKIYQHVKYVKTRSLGARWAPTSRPAARTPRPTGPPDPRTPDHQPRTPNPRPGPALGPSWHYPTTNTLSAC